MLDRARGVAGRRQFHGERVVCLPIVRSEQRRPSQVFQRGLAGDLRIGDRTLGLVLDIGGYYKNVVTLAPSLDITYDEIDMAPGRFRMKKGGGAAGHNGIRSIIASALGGDFRRARMGVGHPGNADLVYGYVLSDFHKADADWVAALIDACAQAAPQVRQRQPGLDANADLAAVVPLAGLYALTQPFDHGGCERTPRVGLVERAVLQQAQQPVHRLAALPVTRRTAAAEVAAATGREATAPAASATTPATSRAATPDDRRAAAAFPAYRARHSPLE